MTNDVLKIDPVLAIDKIARTMKQQIHKLRRRGTVIGLSGGIDSSVAAALCVHAVGADNTFGLLMPEHDSDPDSLRLGQVVADALGIRTVIEDIGPILDASGCYTRRDDYIRRMYPWYGPGCKCKLVLPSAIEGGYNLSWLVVQSPDGKEQRARPPLDVYLGIVAASNMKQRTRKGIEYYYADRLNYVVIGTPNLLEYDQGFFVKNGDGAADLKPIAHLYKSQVYQLAGALDIPDEIRHRLPTTDTYSLPQTQEEFYFSLPYDKMDLCLFAVNNEIPADEVAPLVGLTISQVNMVYRDIASKRRATVYQHSAPLLIEPVSITTGS